MVIMEKGLSNFGNLATIQRYVKTVDYLSKSLENKKNVFTDLQMSTACSKLKEAVSTSLIEYFKNYASDEEYETKVAIKLEDFLWKKVFYNPINLFKNASKSDWHADEIDFMKKHIEEGIKFYIFMIKEYCSNVKLDEGLTSKLNLRRSVVYCVTCLADLSRYFALDLNKKYDVEILVDVLPINYYQQILQFKPSSELTLMNLGTVYQDWLGEPLKAYLLYVAAIPSEKASYYANKKLSDLLKSANSSFNIKESYSEESFINSILNTVYCLHSDTITSNYVSEVCVKLLRDFNYLLSGDKLSEETLLLSSAVLAQSYNDVILEQRKPIFARLMASLLIAITSCYCKRVKGLITTEFSDDFYETYMKGIVKSIPKDAEVENYAKEETVEETVLKSDSDDEKESLENEKWLKNRRRRKIASILPEDSDDDSTVSDNESTSSLSDSDSDLSDDADTLSDCDSETSDVILESGSDQEDEVKEVPAKDDKKRVIPIIVECDSLGALLPSICLLTEWMCETTLSKKAFPWVNDANMSDFYKVLHQLSVMASNILEEKKCVPPGGLSDFLKLVDENCTTFSDFVMQSDHFKLPKVTDFPLLLSLRSTETVSDTSHPEIVSANLKGVLSCLVEENEEPQLLSRSDELLLYCLRYKSYLHKLSQFDDCPLSYDMSAGTFTVLNLPDVEYVKPGDVEDVKPGDVEDVKPGDVEDVKPGDVEDVKPGDVEDVKPGDVEDVKPGDVEDVKPGDSSKEKEENGPTNEKLLTELKDFSGEERVRGIVRCKLPSSEMRHIVLDVTALSRNIPLVKRLVTRTTGNTVYIAQQVLKELDEEKYRSIDSRRVSKWLQGLLSSWKCPSTLKLEAKNQKKKLNVLDYPNRQQRVTWDWFQTLEFVFWLSTVVTDGSVIVLTGHTKRKVQELPLPLEECVKAAGAELHFISDFQLNSDFLTNG